MHQGPSRHLMRSKSIRLSRAIMEDQIVALDPRWRFALVRQLADHGLGHDSIAGLVLLQKTRKRRFNINDLNARVVVRKQIQPTLTGLAHRISGVECE